MVDISQDDDMRKAIDLAKSIYTPSPDEQYTQANILPYRKYSSGKIEFDPTAGLMGAIGSAITATGRAMKGEIPLHEINEEGEVVPSQKAIGEALNVAGNIMGGGIPASALERSGGMMLGTSGTRMVPEAAAVQLAKRQLSPVGLYSHGAEAAMAIPQAKGAAEQMVGMLRKQPGVSDNELINAGILTPEGKVHPDFASRGTITREDLSSHLQSSMPQVEESVYTGDDPRSALHRYGHHEDLVLPNGENYREVVLRLGGPKKRVGVLSTGHILSEEDLSNPTVLETAKKIGLTMEERYADDPIFQSGHYIDPNVLAHIRMSDRVGPNGEKILHVEEVQSDWGQEGREKGFVKQEGVLPEGWSVHESKRGDGTSEWYVVNNNNTQVAPYASTQQEAINLATKEGNKANIPSAPYVTSTQGWTDLALKRVLKEAAEGGYDKVVWTPGAEQAKRYNLSKHVGELRYEPFKENGKTFYEIEALNPEGERVFAKDNIAENELNGLLGKELTQKIINDEGKYMQDRPLRDWRSLSGLDIQTGGEGMKEYYDKILPKRLQFLAQKYDKNAKLGQSVIKTHGDEWPFTARIAHDGKNYWVAGQSPSVSTSAEQQLSPKFKSYEEASNHRDLLYSGYNQSVNSLDITPQMRESILRGQGAFKKGGAVMPHHSLEDIMKLARKHFDDGGDVRGGDNPGGLSGDTGAFSGGYSDRDLQSLYSSAMDSGSFLRDVAQQTERPEYYSDRGGGRSFTDAALDIANQVIGITPAQAGEKIYGTGGILPQVISGGQIYENQNELNRIRAEQDAARARSEAYSIAKAQADQAEKSASFPITGYEAPIGQTTGFGANVSGIIPTGQFTPSAEDLTQSLTTTAGLVGSGRGIAGPTSQDISNQQFFDRLNTNQMARAAIRDMATTPEEPARQSPFEAFSQAITSNRPFPDVTQTSPFDAYTRATISPRQFPTSNLARDPEAADRAINAARAAATGSAAASVTPQTAPINQPARPITATPSTARAPEPVSVATPAATTSSSQTAVLPASKAAAPAPEEQAPVITTPSQVPPMPPIPYRDLGAGNLLDNVLKTFGLDTESWINNKSKQYEEQGMSPSNAAIQASYDLRDLQMNMNKQEYGRGNRAEPVAAPAVAPVATTPVAPIAPIAPNYTPYVYGQNIPYANYGAYGNFGANPFVYNTGINWAAVPGYRADGGKVVGNNALANSLRMAKAGNR